MSKATARYMAGADAAVSKLVKWRDGYECQRCQTDQFLQCAHLISRSYKSIRTELENATTLCRSCHMYFTHHPLEWESWCDDQWPGRFLDLKHRALKHERVEWKAERDRLVALVKDAEA